MNVKIKFKNSKIYKGEKIADIIIKSQKSIKPIVCPASLNSAAIDEFLLIFLVAAKAKGISYFEKFIRTKSKRKSKIILGVKNIK